MKAILLLALSAIAACIPSSVFGQSPSGRGAPVQESDPWHLNEPFWSAPIVHGESVLFLTREQAQRPTARLLFAPSRILRVARADGSLAFEEGTDYVLDAASGTLELPEGSRIPALQADELFPPAGSPRSIPHKTGDPSRGVLFDNDHWFHDHQVEVTYEHKERWHGYRPEVARESLPRTLAKLQRGEPLTIAATGDSITFGLNASKRTGVEPHMPIYPELVADALRTHFGSDVTLVNRAVDGGRLEQGLRDLDALLEAEPDLILIAYGMNHFGSRDAASFRQLLATMLERIWAVNPDTEIILLAPMHGNPQWHHTPADQYLPHRDVLASFVGPRVALADLTTLWGQMLERKRLSDLTGNGVNHPNDFGHRVYAAVVLGLLRQPSATE